MIPKVDLWLPHTCRATHTYTRKKQKRWVIYFQMLIQTVDSLVSEGKENTGRVDRVTPFSAVSEGSFPSVGQSLRAKVQQQEGISFKSYTTHFLTMENCNRRVLPE